MRVVLDTTILVRAGASPYGLARHLLLAIITAKHPLILSNEMLHELAKVLRYPRVMAIHGLPEMQIYDFVEFLMLSLDALAEFSIRRYATLPGNG